MLKPISSNALCRVALLAQSGRLTADTKLLTWGQPYEYEARQMGGTRAAAWFVPAPHCC